MSEDVTSSHARRATGSQAGRGLDALLAARPDLYRDYRRFYGLFWDRALIPRDLLELVRLFVARLHGCESELAIRYVRAGEPLVDEGRAAAVLGGEPASSGDDGERACLAFAEMFVRDVHAITDADFAAVRDHLGVAGSVAFTEALALFDGFMRLRKVLGVEAIATPAHPAFVEMPTPESPALV